MDVILKQDVDQLGLRGDVVNVARGYARNFLLPRGLAELATPALLKELAKREAQRARHEAKTADEARTIAGRLEAIELRFDVAAGPTGSLFGSVTATSVADRLWEAEKIRVDRRKLTMDAIKRVGRYSVAVTVLGDVTADIRLVVAPPGEEPPELVEEVPEAVEAVEAVEVVEAAPAPAAETPVETVPEEEPAEEADLSDEPV